MLMYATPLRKLIIYEATEHWNIYPVIDYSCEK